MNTDGNSFFKLRCVFLFLILCSALAGCSRPPSAGVGQQAIEDRVKRDSEGCIKLVQFRKTNGQSAEINGVKIYTLDYETEIEFLEACKWNIPIFAGTIMNTEASFRTTKSSDKTLGAAAQLMEASMNPGTEVSKGQRVKLIGAIRFEKKEKGWWIDSVKVTSIIPGDESAGLPGQPSRTPAQMSAFIPKASETQGSDQLPQPQVSEAALDEPSVAAERQYRQGFESGSKDMKLVSYKKRDGRKGRDIGNLQLFESYTVDFEAEIEFQKDKHEPRLDFHRGDRVKFTGAMRGKTAKGENDWLFDPPGTSVHYLSASRDFLFAQFKFQRQKPRLGSKPAKPRKGVLTICANSTARNSNGPWKTS